MRGRLSDAKTKEFVLRGFRNRSALCLRLLILVSELIISYIFFCL